MKLYSILFYIFSSSQPFYICILSLSVFFLPFPVSVFLKFLALLFASLKLSSSCSCLILVYSLSFSSLFSFASISLLCFPLRSLNHLCLSLICFLSSSFLFAVLPIAYSSLILFSPVLSPLHFCLSLLCLSMIFMVSLSITSPLFCLLLFPICVLRHFPPQRGRILGRHWDEILKSFPPCFSQPPLLTDFTTPPPKKVVWNWFVM